MELNDISYKIIGAAHKIHKHFGPGLLESAYKKCLCYLLRKEGLYVETEKGLPLVFEEEKSEVGYRLDIWVERKIVVEVKVADNFADVHMAQLITYLKLSGCKPGLLLNFKVTDMRKGIKRIIN